MVYKLQLFSCYAIKIRKTCYIDIHKYTHSLSMASESFRHKRLKLETYFQDRSKIVWFLSYNSIHCYCINCCDFN